MNGDDIDDDFVLDDIVALSDPEDEPEIAPLDDEDEFVEAQEAPPPAELLKKRKRREKEKERKKRKIAAAPPAEQPLAAAQDPQQVSDYLASMQRKSFPKYSDLELDDLRIPAGSIVDATSWTGPRTLDQLVNFIKQVLPMLHKRLQVHPEKHGSPRVVYIAGAALRVADIVRTLKDKKLLGNQAGDVAKLFARHIKLPEHVSYLQRTFVSAAAGTPGRIAKLIEEPNALRINGISHIILDTTFRDAKNRNLLEIPETRDEVLKGVVANPHVLKAIKEGRIQIALF